MLSDRSYMRDSYQPRRTSVLTWLISAIVAAFVLQNIFARWVDTSAFERLFGLSRDGLLSGFGWTLLTYGFLHTVGNLLEIVGNLLALYFIGRELLPLLGNRRFLGLYGAALMSGGMVWTAVHWTHPGLPLVGASPAITALFIVFACFFPDRPIQLLIFFLFPVTFKPKYLAYALVAIDVCGFAFYEILGSPSPFGFAPSAHLGGIAVGWIYFRFLHDSQWPVLRRKNDIELPKWMKRGAKAVQPSPEYRVNLGSRVDLRAEVDRILDKINSHGFGSLSAEEKRVLDEARDSMSRR